LSISEPSVQVDFRFYSKTVDKIYIVFISLSLSVALQPLWTLAAFSVNLYTVGRTPWTGDQTVSRTLPTQRTTQTQNKYTNIHASSGIRTHDPSVRADEDGSCLRLRGHCDRPSLYVGHTNCFTLLVIPQ
jgi:hypothetical protein